MAELVLSKIPSIRYINSAYELVADEYYDNQKHPTCHCFNRLSRLYLERQIPEPLGDNKILEVGSGDSSVAAILHARGYSLERLIITDASPKMLEYSKKWKHYGAKLRVADAHCLAKSCSNVSLVVASLGDPYNTVDFWREASRVLQPNGKLIFTLPSFEWAARFRSRNEVNSFHSAEFQLKDGSILDVPSFILPLNFQIQMIEEAGYMVSHFEALGLNDLDIEDQSPKLHVFGNDISSLILGFTAHKQKYPVSHQIRQQWKESLALLSQP